MSQVHRFSQCIPKSTFDVYQSEGDIYFRRRCYISAIKAYSLALNLRSNCISCLLKRAKCYMSIAQPLESMADIETALEIDPLSYKATFQMAEIYYQSTAFESALVYFHRGRNIRPAARDFVLGVTKAETAIDNVIGEATGVKFTVSKDAQDGDTNILSTELPGAFFANFKPDAMFSKKHLRQLKRLMGKSYYAVRHIEQLLVAEGDRLRRLQKQHQDSGDDANSKQRLQMYLKNSTEIHALVKEAHRYLRIRSEFWRQQEPMYRRARKTTEPKSVKEEKGPSRGDLKALQRVLHMLQDINDVQQTGDHEKTLRLCLGLRKDVKSLNPGILEKQEIMADIWAFEAVSHFQLQNFQEARDCFGEQLKICRDEGLQHHIPRCLENLGRAYAKLGSYRSAESVWIERLRYDITGLDKAWLHYEIALCDMELGKYEDAIVHGLACKKTAETEFDLNWELKAGVLIAQAHFALDNLSEAQFYFQNAQYTAYVLNNQTVERLLTEALEDVDKAIETNERKAVEEEYERLFNQAEHPMLFTIRNRNQASETKSDFDADLEKGSGKN
uniref:Outer dynein arm-docking complex subunit 4 n=1 Tax=Mesocestoides corti TaxID=53468 RepID=A0A5K3F6H0_MESCO